MKDALLRWDMHVEQHANELRHAVAHQLEGLASLQSVFNTYGDVSREQFAGITRLQLQHHSELLALEWVPRIESETQLRRYEQRARQSGVGGFQVVERGIGGQIVAARTKPEYYPVYYLESRERHLGTMGFDLASDPVRLLAMKRSAFSGVALASGVVPHLLEAGQEKGLVIVQPVYRNGMPLSNPQQRMQALRGFVIGVYRVSALLEHMSALHDHYESVYFEDITDPAAPVALVDEADKKFSNGPFSVAKEITFAGRIWRITVSAPPDHILLSWYQHWDILLSGLLLTLLLAAWYFSSDRKMMQMERLAGELQQANDELAARSRQVQQTRGEWERAFDAVRHPIFLHDQEGCILKANRAYVERAGQPLQALTGQPYWNVFPQGDGPLASCKQAIKLDGAEVDEELVLDDGSIFVSRGFAVLNDSGEYAYSMHIMEDWTEQRRAEAQIRAHEARIEAVFRAPIDIAFIVTDFSGEKGNIIEANPGAEALFGVSGGELAGQAMIDLAAEESRLVLEEVQRRVSKKRTQWKGEVSFQRRDGSSFPTEMLCYPVFSGDGVLSFTFCVIQDISDRRRSLTLLKENEERFRGIFEGLPIGYQSMDHKGFLLEVNQAWLDILGYGQEDVVGSNFRDFLLPEFQGVFDDWFRRLQGGSSSHSTELSLVCKDGRVFEALFDARLTFGGGDDHVTRAHCVFTDITDRKRNERALRRASQALEAHTSVNRVVMNSEDVDDLVQRVCEVVVEAGDYPVAWVGLMQEEEEPVLKRTGYFIQGDGEWPFQQQSYSLKRYSDRRNSLAVRAFLDDTILASNLLPAEPLCDGCVERESCVALTEANGLRSVIAIPLKGAGTSTPTGVMVVFSKDERAFREEERQRLKVLANDLSFGIHWLETWNENLQARFEYGRSLLQTVSSIARSLEVRDPYTAGHQQQVGRLAVAIAKELGLDEDMIQGIELGGMIHDIGQIFVPTDLLGRPGKLTETEFELIKSHPMVGYQIMADTDLPWPVKEMIYQHHERIDGSGYPQGLTGEEMVLEAKILGVADAMDAMISERPYRQAMKLERALEEIEKGRGKIYQEEVVDACVRLIRENRFQWS